MDKLDCINTFIKVVENGNFSIASRDLGLTRDQVAKRICYLESHFNTSLLIRTTRKMRLTHSGEKFYQHCKVIMSEFEWAENEIFYEQKYPEGELSINAPHSFSQTYITDVIATFMEKYPGIKINLFLTDKFIDFYDNRHDIILRVSQEIDNSNTRIFRSHQRYFYATPHYFKENGTPHSPDELKNHNLLFYSQDTQNPKINLLKDQKKESIYCTPKLLCNNGAFLLEFCKKHQGIVFLPDFLASNDEQSGNIIRCLDDYHSPELHFYALTPNKQNLPKKVELFIDHLDRYFK